MYKTCHKQPFFKDTPLVVGCYSIEESVLGTVAGSGADMSQPGRTDSEIINRHKYCLQLVFCSAMMLG